MAGFGPSLLRRIQHPVVTLIAIAVFTYELMSVPPWTTVGQVLHGRSTPAMAPFTPREWYFIEEDVGVWRLVDPDVESYDQISGVLMTRPEDAVVAVVVHHEDVSGFWAVTRASSGNEIILVPANTKRQTPIPLAELERRFADYIMQEWSISPGTTERIVWAGYLHTALAFLSAVIGVLSLGWTRRIPVYVRAMRARRALSANRCYACNYDLGDFTFCPECGQTVDDTKALARS